MGQVIARVRAGVGSAPRVGRSARRCHSPGSGGANRLESSAGAMLGIPLSRRHVGGLLLAGPAGTIVGRSNTVSSGPLAWVMIHRHHAAERTGLGLDQNAWVSFGKQGWVNSRECRRNDVFPGLNGRASTRYRCIGAAALASVGASKFGRANKTCSTGDKDTHNALTSLSRI